MYDDLWWNEYKDWAEETADIHKRLEGIAVEYLWGLDLDDSATQVDLGCGRLQQARGVGPHDWYIGVDLDHGPATGVLRDFIELQDFLEGNRMPEDPCFNEDFRELLVRDNFLHTDFDMVCTTLGRDVWVSSLYATELYCHDVDGLYRRAFEDGVSAILSVGVHYRGRDVNAAIGEPGSRIRQTSPVPPRPNGIWDEVRFSAAVPSKMFGPDVVEVWRVLTKVSQ